MRKIFLFTATFLCLSIFANAQGKNYKLTNACGATAAFTATTPVCYPNCVNFNDMSTASSGFIINWYWKFGDNSISTVDNPNHCYANPGTYITTLIITTNLSCIDSTSDTIIVYPQPAVGFTFSPDPPDYSHPTVTFTDTAKDSLVVLWYWNFGDGTLEYSDSNQTLIHTYPGDGVYHVCLTVTDSHGCTSMTCDSIIISPTHLGINNITNPADGISVFPNPTSNAITVQMELIKKENVEFILYNTMGQIVYAKNLLEQSGMVNHEIDLSLLSDGIYLLKIDEENKFYTKKIIKQE